MKTGIIVAIALGIILLGGIVYLVFKSPETPKDTGETHNYQQDTESSVTSQSNPNGTTIETDETTTDESNNQTTSENQDLKEATPTPTPNDEITLSVDRTTESTVTLRWTQTSTTSTEATPLSWRVFQNSSSDPSVEHHQMWYRSPLAHTTRTIDELEPGTYHFRACVYEGEYTENTGTCQQYSNDVEVKIESP